MSSGWQEAAAQQAEEVSSRLRQLLITGLGLLRSELGLELGLEPQRYPAWVFLAVPVSLGLLFLLLLLHCATSRGPPSSKRPAPQEKELPRPPLPSKTVKVEEPKKKSRKKPADKAKPNGRPVELSEEVLIPAVKKESPKQAADADKKNEKLKKNKKKPKADTKPTQPSSNQDKKEAEEGNWETKISNKEKRQQRKRDKGADADTVPDTESFTVVSTQSANIRKAKGPSEASALNGSSWNEKPTKVIPAQQVEEKWVPPSNTAGKKKAEPCTWNQDNVDANGKDWSAPWSERSIFPGIATWSNVDARLNSSEKRPPFSTMGINNAVSASVTEKQWDVTPAEPSADDEWSGLNGLNSSDPSSDWNAPAEEWGNYGEEEPALSPQTEEPEQEVPKVSDDDKEKDEQSAQTSAGSKAKKKKKKKKKQEESGSPTQEAESTRDAGDDYKEDSVPTPVIPTVVVKNNEPKEKPEKRQHTVLTEAPIIHKGEKSSGQAQQPQEPNASVPKQNSAPPPSQAKSEESWESPKQVKKKKKARRET
ncbi:protein LYRIC isoform X2 [Ranitomeya variabilis]|uniref:protein LYRIC isoform X2 n=1 Tax=Ranitomeya variabilis TaxID=490064 RepID=UPI004056066A